ncbi:hypothetical protein L249_8322 [Ophiocordyceps polyrhachis-furcata BCC 54312]|uniref:Uncharacterized protein n=1 Tax=Ophiocordyceps polyrhachis-furcata BCC 54312 TaxID=1330021 RepID=A0A367KZD3_9HYPO|nr:hypothetical protein L249_8322 [Ophiocordyceps polyrhachis-furcata BCC 54312]
MNFIQNPCNSEYYSVKPRRSFIRETAPVKPRRRNHAAGLTFYEFFGGGRQGGTRDGVFWGL